MARGKRGRREIKKKKSWRQMTRWRFQEIRLRFADKIGSWEVENLREKIFFSPALHFEAFFFNPFFRIFKTLWGNRFKIVFPEISNFFFFFFTFFSVFKIVSCSRLLLSLPRWEIFPRFLYIRFIHLILKRSIDWNNSLHFLFSPHHHHHRMPPAPPDNGFDLSISFKRSSS